MRQAVTPTGKDGGMYKNEKLYFCRIVFRMTRIMCIGRLKC